MKPTKINWELPIYQKHGRRYIEIGKYMDFGCFSNGAHLLVVNKGSTSYLRNVDPDKVDLEFICNTNEIKYIDKWKLEDYDKVYNLSYQKGYRPIYAVDKGAEVSKKALKNKYQRLLEEAYQKQRSAEFDIERYSDEIEKLGDV